MLTLYAQVKRAAEGHLDTFPTDLTVHDRKFLDAMVPGQMVFWCAWQSGTHIAHRDGAVEAVESTFGPQQWYSVEACDTAGHGHVVAVSREVVVATLRRWARLNGTRSTHGASTVQDLAEVWPAANQYFP